MGKGCLFPSSDFIAKNQLARESSQSVSPVTIPALNTIVDRQFKEDRTLCPVRALGYYLQHTKGLRGSQSLLFISFKKGHTSDIRPATLSSWLKQTIRVHTCVISPRCEIHLSTDLFHILDMTHFESTDLCHITQI